MASAPPRTGKLQILAVDDDLDTAENLAFLLRREGHEVNIAPDGPTALRLAQDHEPDVVLLDIGLPGMNGYEVARHFHQQNSAKRPLLIAVTGRAEKEARQLSAEAGIDLYLVKPVNPSQLNAVLRSFGRVVLPGPPDSN